MERTSSISRKAMAGQQKAEMMIAGEQLRLKLHDGKLIKDRRYHLRTYPNCFIAQELIDWLLSHKEAPDRAAAVGLMQHLMDHDIIHHVCDKRPVFKDAKLLYRFRKDDGTFPFNTEVKIFMHGQRLYEHLTGDKNSILQLREEHGVSHQRSFPGCQLIDWLLQNGEAESRRQGLELCRALQEHGIIQHGKGREALVGLLKYDASQKRSVTGGQCWESWETKEVARKHHFFDSGLLYQFCINFRRRRRLFELLNSNEHENDEEAIMATQEENHPDSPLALHKSPTLEKNSAFQSVVLGKELKPVTGGRRTSLNSTGFPPPVQLFSTTATRCNPKSVLRRNYTCEELLQPGAPFAKKVLTVIGDDLGWGFVIRGRAPCYVQAVDPGSPAAAAGVKVRQFVCQVNGHCVLYLDYRTVSRLVMTGHRTVELEVMEPLI